MSKARRPIAFILANTEHGTLILNRNDENGQGGAVYGVGIEILTNGSFCADEVELALKLLELRRRVYGDGVVALDCGANIGVHSIEWGRAMTGWGRVIAIEAQERIFYALAGNIALNNCFNVDAVFAAISEAVGTMQIPKPNYFERASFGSLELVRRSGTENIGQAIDYSAEAMVPVRVITIDSLTLPRIDLIKLDVEGMELDVLRGGMSSIDRFRPILLVEHHKTDRGKLDAFLSEHSYETIEADQMNLLAMILPRFSGHPC
jgi:FkbM family methyltransferase